MRKMRTHRLLLTICLVGLLPSCAESVQIDVVQPCGPVSKHAAPVMKECIAAAIAERAFLQHMQHPVQTYMITRMEHSATDWWFVILLGDEKKPAADDAHYMVSVARASARTNVIPAH